MFMAHTQLNDNDRFYIEQRLVEAYFFSQIARILDCVHSTISREIKRHIPDNSHSVDCPHLASKQDKETRSTATNRLDFNCVSKRMKVFIHEHPSTHTSPDVISGELALKLDVMLSENTLYRYI
ncbi:helix-turn-helix domain-containing protein [Candidatus Enterovibrio escicola]|nr:helix-turn-helix domain-containing protein [Candidatus Enterovibrio escacola]